MTRRTAPPPICPVPDFEAMLTGDIRGKVIGIPKEYRMDGMPGEIETLWTEGAEMLKDAGAKLRDITLPHTKYALPDLLRDRARRGVLEPRAL
jgi:Asp-tRNA(Asn)/Glu-tRNA(Gln) amidotransferase A subunit family amidase